MTSVGVVAEVKADWERAEAFPLATADDEASAPALALFFTLFGIAELPSPIIVDILLLVAFAAIPDGKEEELVS